MHTLRRRYPLVLVRVAVFPRLQFALFFLLVVIIIIVVILLRQAAVDLRALNAELMYLSNTALVKLAVMKRLNAKPKMR